jgi:hypothetical protein
LTLLDLELRRWVGRARALFLFRKRLFCAASRRALSMMNLLLTILVLEPDVSISGPGRFRSEAWIAAKERAPGNFGRKRVSTCVDVFDILSFSHCASCCLRMAISSASSFLFSSRSLKYTLLHDSGFEGSTYFCLQLSMSRLMNVFQSSASTPRI